MARKSGGGPKDPKEGNVVRLFGGPLEQSTDEIVSDDGGVISDEMKQIMIGPLKTIAQQILDNKVTGVIIIAITPDKVFGGESYIGGPGVWGGMDRAIGLIELVKHDMVQEVHRKHIG